MSHPNLLLPVIYSTGPAQVVASVLIPYNVGYAAVNKVLLYWEQSKTGLYRSQQKIDTLQKEVTSGLKTAKFHAICSIPVVGTLIELEQYHAEEKRKDHWQELLNQFSSDNIDAIADSIRGDGKVDMETKLKDLFPEFEPKGPSSDLSKYCAIRDKVFKMLNISKDFSKSAFSREWCNLGIELRNLNPGKL